MAHCAGSGSAPSPEATKKAQEAARAAYIKRHGHKPWFADYPIPNDLQWGRKGCGVCGNAYFVKADGTLPKHGKKG